MTTANQFQYLVFEASLRCTVVIITVPETIPNLHTNLNPDPVLLQCILGPRFSRVLLSMLARLPRPQLYNPPSADLSTEDKSLTPRP